MKIAGVLGAEEMRGSLIVPGHAGSNPQGISFAESFGKDMTADSREGAFPRTQSCSGASDPG